MSPRETDGDRLRFVPNVLRSYAKDIDRHGKPLDSGLSPLLTFCADELDRLTLALAQAERERDEARAREAAMRETLTDVHRLCISAANQLEDVGIVNNSLGAAEYTAACALFAPSPAANRLMAVVEAARQYVRHDTSIDEGLRYNRLTDALASLDAALSPQESK